MPDYSKGKIYKIISNETDDVYIGSTIQSLSVRLSGHRRDYKRYLGGTCAYMSSFDILKYNDAKIILIEECPCNSREQLLKIEQYKIDNMDCINKRRAYRTNEQRIEAVKQYQLNNLDKVREVNKLSTAKWRKNNRDKINSKIECDICNKYISSTNIKRHKKVKHQT
jgi:hypothetical protein